MSLFSPQSSILVLFVSCCFHLSTSSSWCPAQFVLQNKRKFEQKTNRFWEYKEESNTWVELELPYDLFSCVNDNCTRVGSISSNKSKKDHVVEKTSRRNKESVSEIFLPQRKRLVSMRKMSETSIWVMGQSGSIYERFWNGVQWVIAPHDLPPIAAPANSVFIVNHTILALSDAGYLYQMELNENSQPVWVHFSPADELTSNGAELSAIPIKSGVISNDEEKVYFCTKNGNLLELTGTQPPRWLNHGRPPGANVAGIADAGTVRREVIFTISSSGDLYEYDRSSKPSWKKHVRSEVGEAAGEERTTFLLKPLTGSVIHDSALHSTSLILLTKGGNLVERRLIQRKWKWAIHELPEDEHLLSITTLPQHEINEKSSRSLFLTSASGNVWEYKVPRLTGSKIADSWVNHMHPPNTKIATSLSSGLQFQVGRIFFPLDDGRLAELHHTGQGGETMGPTNQNTARRKGTTRPKYVWSILDAPETEGWNAEYCTEERGPTNCIMGVNDELTNNIDNGVTSRGRKGNIAQQSYLIPSISDSKCTEENNYKMQLDNNLINRNFRLRVMHGGRSFFLITESGVTLEYLNSEKNVWLWLRHDHEVAAMRGAVGDYNGSLFLVDEHGSLLIRERNGNELGWLNCTAMKKGRQIIGGPPWNNKYLGTGSKVTTEDSLFFVSKTGRLLQFIIALRKFKWKDCKYPQTTKIASIVDQEGFRYNIIFVIGRNGRLYQYNKVTEIWHEHRQSQHLVLSMLPGTATRSSSQSLKGSLFMLMENGGLVEYHWDGSEVGWNWVEHGTPHQRVSLAGVVGPCFHGDELFLVGLDGNVYLRYLDHTTWRWKNCGAPSMPSNCINSENENVCLGDDDALEENDSHNCDSRVAPVRPIPFSDDSVIFELKDGRLAEMRRRENGDWVWSRTIGTPTSLCISHFWTGLAS